jgi:hypothetical protein
MSYDFEKRLRRVQGSLIIVERCHGKIWLAQQKNLGRVELIGILEPGCLLAFEIEILLSIWISGLEIDIFLEVTDVILIVRDLLLKLYSISLVVRLYTSAFSDQLSDRVPTPL